MAVQSRLDLALLEGQLSRALRLQVEVSDLSVDSSGTAVLEGLRARDPAGREVLFAPRTQARLPLMEALMGRPTLEGVVLEGLRVTLDERRLQGFSSPEGGDGGGGGGMPFPLEFRDASFTWEQDGRTLALEGADGRIAAADPGQPLKLALRARGLQGLEASYAPGPEGWTLDLEVRGFRESLLRDLAGLAPAASAAPPPADSSPSPASPEAPPSPLPDSVDARIHVVRQGKATSVEAEVDSRTSWAKGPLTVQASSGPEGGWKGHLAAEGLEVYGFPLKSARFPFTWKSETLRVQEARVDSPQGRVALEFTLAPGGLQGSLESTGLQVFALPGLEKAGVEASPARVKASLDARGRLQADLDWDRLGPFEGAWVSAEGTRKDGTLRLDRLEMGRGDARLAQATLDLAPGKALKVQVLEASAGRLLRLLPAAAPLEPEGFSAEGTLDWNLETGQASGRLAAGPGRLRGEAVEALKGQVNHDPDGAWTFEGTASALGRDLSVRGSLAADGQVTAKIAGQGLALHRLPGAKDALPGFRGKVDVDLAYEKGSGRLRLDASDLTRDGRALPKVGAMITWKDGILQVADGSVALDPPVPFQGQVDLEKESLSLESTLKGQSLAALGALAGLPKGTDGKVEGTLKVQGSLQQPKATFQGKVTDLLASGVKVPEASVRMEAGKKVSLEVKVAALDLQSLPAVKKAAPDLQGKAAVAVTTADLEGDVRIEATSSGVSWKNEKFGELKAVAVWRGSKVDIKSLDLPLSPPARLSGTYDTASDRLDLKAALKGQDVARLRPFLPAGTPAVAGKLTGDLGIQGTASKPLLQFQGKASGLAYGDQALGDATLRLRMAPTGDGTAEIGGLRAETMKVMPGLKGAAEVTALLSAGKDPRVTLRLTDASWDGRKLPPLEARLVAGKDAVAVNPLRLDFKPPVAATGTFKTATKTFDLSAPLAGTSLADLAALAPSGLPQVEGRLDGTLKLTGQPSDVKARYEGRLSDLVMAGQRFGSGQVAATVQSTSQALRVQMRGSDFEAAQVEPLASRYPGLKGRVGFEVDRQGDTTTVHLALRNATMDAGAMPELDGQFKLKGTILAVDRLQASLTPPVILTGHYDLTGGGIALDGTLQGQSLGDLIRLGGGRPPADLAGRLQGPVKITGPSYNPTVAFEGRVDSLTLKGTSLGAGRLTVKVSKALEGELVLDQPVPLSTVGGMGGPLGSLPILQGVLDATGVKITGATLSGTPGDPKVTPRVAGIRSGGGNTQAAPGPGVRLPGGIEIKIPGR